MPFRNLQTHYPRLPNLNSIGRSSGIDMEEPPQDVMDDNSKSDEQADDFSLDSASDLIEKFQTCFSYLHTSKGNINYLNNFNDQQKQLRLLHCWKGAEMAKQVGVIWRKMKELSLLDLQRNILQDLECSKHLEKKISLLLFEDIVQWKTICENKINGPIKTNIVELAYVCDELRHFNYLITQYNTFHSTFSYIHFLGVHNNNNNKYHNFVCDSRNSSIPYLLLSDLLTILAYERSKYAAVSCKEYLFGTKELHATLKIFSKFLGRTNANNSNILHQQQQQHHHQESYLEDDEDNNEDVVSYVMELHAEPIFSSYSPVFDFLRRERSFIENFLHTVCHITTLLDFEKVNNISGGSNSNSNFAGSSSCSNVAGSSNCASDGYSSGGASSDVGASAVDVVRTGKKEVVADVITVVSADADDDGEVAGVGNDHKNNNSDRLGLAFLKPSPNCKNNNNATTTTSIFYSNNKTATTTLKTLTPIGSCSPSSASRTPSPTTSQPLQHKKSKTVSWNDTRLTKQVNQLIDSYFKCVWSSFTINFQNFLEHSQLLCNPDNDTDNNNNNNNKPGSYSSSSNRSNSSASSCGADVKDGYLVISQGISNNDVVPMVVSKLFLASVVHEAFPRLLHSYLLHLSAKYSMQTAAINWVAVATTATSSPQEVASLSSSLVVLENYMKSLQPMLYVLQLMGFQFKSLQRANLNLSSLSSPQASSSSPLLQSSSSLSCVDDYDAVMKRVSMSCSESYLLSRSGVNGFIQASVTILPSLTNHIEEAMKLSLHIMRSARNRNDEDDDDDGSDDDGGAGSSYPMVKIVKKYMKELEFLHDNIVDLSNLSMKSFNELLYRRALVFFVNNMPPKKMWRKKEVRHNNEYLVKCVEILLKPIFSSTRSLAPGDNYQGACLLEQDINYIKAWIADVVDDTNLSDQLLKIDVFQQMHSVLDLLKQQPNKQQHQQLKLQQQSAGSHWMAGDDSDLIVGLTEQLNNNNKTATTSISLQPPQAATMTTTKNNNLILKRSLKRFKFGSLKFKNISTTNKNTTTNKNASTTTQQQQPNKHKLQHQQQQQQQPNNKPKFVRSARVSAPSQESTDASNNNNNNNNVDVFNNNDSSNNIFVAIGERKVISKKQSTTSAVNILISATSNTLINVSDGGCSSPTTTVNILPLNSMDATSTATTSTATTSTATTSTSQQQLSSSNCNATSNNNMTATTTTSFSSTTTTTTTSLLPPLTSTTTTAATSTAAATSSATTVVVQRRDDWLALRVRKRGSGGGSGGGRGIWSKLPLCFNAGSIDNPQDNNNNNNNKSGGV
ncbi:hypothetical protein HELRODRAFT_183925 [Helobdella robusta]|uniref:Uncharacterized protein n=1 Tax=Helobdella robusta TaxID=6412 RepID=T1FKB0_HELRO|nr:hypothetical protein HELRODRAFT_183925 [Helobdella robusta]ESO09708.1 hypothetical protein HELRODRAFT_183925 [Helobdella robusta]